MSRPARGRVAETDAEPGPGLLDALRALDNDRRLQILLWLKEPARHFRPQVDGDLEVDGVCGLLIAEKLGLSQPTVSEHMRLLVRSGLVRAKRIKQWTFYRRDARRLAGVLRALRAL
ncbi:MAG TPA: winged helix-turn-helix domain-containing protein [Myxococcaceae bacterium]|nr:winged helix-turn-helix domain-containing protein [Myxococcaceae bacterium]